MPGSTLSMSTSTHLETAVSAALAAGELLRSHFGTALEVNEFAAHDIKLELDVRSQELITRCLLERGGTPTLNGQPIRVSTRDKLSDAVLTIGFSKSIETITAGLPVLEYFIGRARKCRLMGSAALDLAYVACGRLDAYIEQGISLWDIAAGWILVETAGGAVDLRPRKDMKEKYSIVASNGVIDLKL